MTDVLGEEQVISALNKVGAFDVAAAEQNAAAALVPALAGKTTRTLTGQMKAGWEAQQGAFVNTVPYASFQEFGTVYVEPMNAISQTWEDSSETAVAKFAEEIDRAASEAGFNS